MSFNSYRIPVIEINVKEDLIRFLIDNPPLCIFENLEEVLNPIGFQWNFTLTARVESEKISLFIVKYNEALYEKPHHSDITAVWLKEALPHLQNWYRGEIKP